MTVLATAFVIFQFAFAAAVSAQSSRNTPELSVAGIELGNREKAKLFLTPGYQPRKGEDGRPNYYFYNAWGSQVMKLTAVSFDDPYFITEIEVFAVGKSYRERHFQADNVKYFSTENGIFIGFKQSAMYFIAGVKNAGSRNQIRAKDVIEIKGEPEEKLNKDADTEVMNYSLADIKLSGDDVNAGYQASYEFHKNNLNRFSVKLVMNETKQAKK